MEPRDWVCLPFFLLGCYTALCSVADWWHARSRR